MQSYKPYGQKKVKIQLYVTCKIYTEKTPYARLKTKG